MIKIPSIIKQLTGFKVTLPEAEVLFHIDGKKSVDEIQSELGYKRLKTMLIIDRYQRKGVLKITRYLAQ